MEEEMLAPTTLEVLPLPDVALAKFILTISKSRVLKIAQTTIKQREAIPQKDKRNFAISFFAVAKRDSFLVLGI